MANNQYLEAAKQIVAFVGGENNVIRVASCATRLRVVVKDDKKIDVDQIEAMDLVKGTFNNGGQFQVILGSQHSRFYLKLVLHQEFEESKQ